MKCSRSGGSPKTETATAQNSMSATIHGIDIAMGEDVTAVCLWDLEKKWFFELIAPTQFGFGESSSMTAASEESIARFSVTSRRIKARNSIRQADQIADCLWPNSRHYTYVDPKKIASKNPGFCFLMAGWRRCGNTKGGLLIMERR